MIKKTISFKTEDFDKNGNIKISSLLMYMQKAAVIDAEQFNASRENLIADGMFFAVYRNIVTIARKITKEIKNAYIITFQSSHDRMRFMRSYFIFLSDEDADNFLKTNSYENAYVYCNSIWVLMDVNKRTLLKSDALNYPVEEKGFIFERPFKVILDESNTKSRGTFTGNDYYIDENNHVNNCAYADIIHDFSSFDETISRFDITYEREILSNEKVEVFSEKTTDGEKFLGVRNSDGGTCFCCEIKY